MNKNISHNNRMKILIMKKRNVKVEIPRTRKNWILVIASFSIILIACKKEVTDNETLAETDMRQGTYFLNEGSFNQNNASVGWAATGKRADNPYLSGNGLALGDVLTCMAIRGDQGFLVLNNSAKVEVIRRKDFRRTGTISGLDYPRWAAAVSDSRLWITDGSIDGSVKIADLTTNTIISQIPVGKGPEKILLTNQLAIVCNSGGWSRDSTVSVIRIATQTVENTVNLSDRPVDIEFAPDSSVWVLCSGETVWNADYTAIINETLPRLWHVQPATGAVLNTFVAGEMGEHPLHFDINNDGTLAFIDGNALQQIDLSNGERSVLLSRPMGSVDVSRSTGQIWCASRSNYVNASRIYQLNAQGMVIDSSHFAGIGTNAVLNWP
jgi:DNA-binding beta-propeller fold protein YncE